MWGTDRRSTADAAPTADGASDPASFYQSPRQAVPNTRPSNTALANVTHPSVRATAYAVNIFVIHALGDAISPAIIGAIADRTSLKTGFLVVSATIVLGGLPWAWAARYLGDDTAAVEAATALPSRA